MIVVTTAWISCKYRVLAVERLVSVALELDINSTYYTTAPLSNECKVVQNDLKTSESVQKFQIKGVSTHHPTTKVSPK